MSHLANSRRLYPLLPRDYIRRRRAIRRITNVVLIAVFSLASAYFITRPTGGTGFRARKMTTNPVPASLGAAPPATTPVPATPVPASAQENGYVMEPGPYTVSQVDELVPRAAKPTNNRPLQFFY